MLFKQVPDGKQEDTREPKYSDAPVIKCFARGFNCVGVIETGEYYHLFGDDICEHCLTEEEEANPFLEIRKADEYYEC